MDHIEDYIGTVIVIGVIYTQILEKSKRRLKSAFSEAPAQETEAP